MQYTIRGIPGVVDTALRERARSQDKSLNDVAIEALAGGAGVSGEPRKCRSLQDIAGTWRSEPEVESVLLDQNRVDADLWK